jgi:flagellin-specific chaperone FliS
LVDDLTIVYGDDNEEIEKGMERFQKLIDKLYNIIQQLRLEINIEKTG